MEQIVKVLQARLRHAKPAVVLLALLVAGCAMYSASTIIDWVDFVRFDGIMYVRSTQSGRVVEAADLGEPYAQVRSKLDGHVHDSGYRPQDGDAAFLEAGTTVYAVRGYSPTFRLAAHVDGQLALFESDTNPHAKVGADLLDIGGKVEQITVNSEDDATTVLATIAQPAQVSQLVTAVLTAPVDQRRASADGTRYFIAFHLHDGTQVVRAYWPGTGELARGILVAPSFNAVIMQALQAAK
ncbi:MAG TPA: hypothetical protein VGP82_20420 [Ktedonobacterales bacterium]|jgi:hypothetical protein|nr:hypothetical protein [Ktedonobacterales bacterium]